MQNHIIELCSLLGLAWTWPLLTMSLLVLFLYGGEAWDAYWRSPQFRLFANWLALGITLAYLGESLDDIYWSLTWSLHYLGSPLGAELINFGPIPNLPFRDVLGAFGVYCHVRAVFVAGDRYSGAHIRLLNQTFIATLILGHLYALLLWAMRG